MGLTRRKFISSTGLGAAALGSGGLKQMLPDQEQASIKEPIQGFDEKESSTDTSREWVSPSDRRIRLGIAGYGYSRFGAAFSLQNHPNVEIAAVSDLIPERCGELAKACRCSRTYPSLEKMLGDDSIEAVFLATDAPSHARHAIESLKRGKHVASAVPAVFGNLEHAEQLFKTVKESSLNYMMFETSVFRNDLYAMRTLYNAGKLGDLVYSEGEYYHYKNSPIPSFKNWRVGLPPMWYPTHSTAYYTGVTGGSYTEVSCLGIPGKMDFLTSSGNPYKNPFGTEIGLFQLCNGAAARMAISWDTPGDSGERGRIRGRKGTFYREYQGLEQDLPDTRKPPLPPGVEPGGHGGSHGYLGHEFVLSIIEKRKPLVDITWALSMTAPGIVAHQSALRKGELMKVPQYR
jgi:predicted dehydrogenase